MNSNDSKKTRAERRENKKKRKMKVSGAKVKELRKIIIKKSKDK
jgi:hypothetical protein